LGSGQQTPVVALHDEAAAPHMVLHGDAAALNSCSGVGVPQHANEYAPLLDVDAILAIVGVLHNVEADNGVGVGDGASADVNHGQQSEPFAVSDNNLRSTVLLGAQRCAPLYLRGSKSRKRTQLGF